MKECIGKELKLARLDKGLSLEQVHELSKINTGTISSYENGKRNMSVEYIEKLLLVYGIQFDIFFKRVSERFHEEGGD